MVQQPQQQMHHMHPPQASPLDSQGGHSPTSSNTSQTPQTTPTSSSGHTPNPAPNRDVPKICGRPGCNNPVQRGPDGWQNDFCSNECVVGQCRDVYSSWSSTTQGPHPGPGGPVPPGQPTPPQSQHPVGAFNNGPPPQPPVATAAVK